MSAVETSIGVPAIPIFGNAASPTKQKIREELPQDSEEVNVLKELSEYIFTSKYARFNETEGRRETWDEAVSRVERMHLNKFSHLPKHLKEEIREAFDLVRMKMVVPSMRSMQFGGAAVEAHNARIYNCAVRHLDSTRAFAELFYLLLCGCGTGVGLSKKYVNQLPELVTTTYCSREPYSYVIPDTIEGWADSLEVLLKSYFKGNELSDKNIQFDYSEIRPAGTPLKTGGGKAPGPMGLRAAHNEIRSLLDWLVVIGQKRLNTIDAYDILMHSADAVLSGGVRRSAVCIIFDKDDELMLNAKVGNWIEEHPQRKRSNNSVLLMRDEVTAEEFSSIVERTKEWGEPGFVFATNPDTLYNPCFEVSFVPITNDGKTAVQFCNLTSINGSKVDRLSNFVRCARAAALIGTLQATYTHFPYLSKEAEELTKSEGLLGVSITAMMENPTVLLNAENQRIAANEAKATNKRWAAILGINEASRVTVIKPEGTSTLALGSMASGIHPAHAHKMFRRIQANKLEPVFQFFKKHNPHLCEPSTHSKSDTDEVITFPVTVPSQALVKRDLNALAHLDIIKSTQKNWVETGTSEVNKKNVKHNVSCTVIVHDNEWEEVINYLYENRNSFAAVSLMPSYGDKKFVQAPMEAVVTEEDHKKFDEMLAFYRQVDYTQLVESTDTTTLMQELSCAGGMCEL